MCIYIYIYIYIYVYVCTRMYMYMIIIILLWHYLSNATCLIRPHLFSAALLV